MKRNSTIDRIRNLTSMDIERLQRSELETLLRRGSRSFYQNVYNLSKNKYGVASAYLANRENKLPRVYTEKQINEMKLPELKRAFKDLVRGSKIQSSTITGSKEIVNKIATRSGASVSEILSLSADDWRVMRELIEENVYTSDQIINYSSKYKQTYANFDKNNLVKYIENKEESRLKVEIDDINEEELYILDADDWIVG